MAQYGCFGKLPVSYEFIRSRLAELAPTGMDRWIGDGLGMARAEVGPGYANAVREMPTYHFVWSMGGPAVAGALRAGRDEAGRAHPFVVFASVGDPVGGGGGWTPAEVGAVVRAAERAGAAAAEARTEDDVKACVAAARELDDALTDSERVLDVAGAAPLARALGIAGGRDGFRAALTWPDAAARTGFECPIGARDGIDAFGDVAFWERLTCARAGLRPGTGVWFWTAPGGGVAGRWIRFSDSPGPRAFVTLLRRRDDDPEVHHVARPADAAADPLAGGDAEGGEETLARLLSGL